MYTTTGSDLKKTQLFLDYKNHCHLSWNGPNLLCIRKYQLQVFSVFTWKYNEHRVVISYSMSKSVFYLDKSFCVAVYGGITTFN